MAKKLESFTFKSSPRYDWDKWLDGSVWQLTPGEDFSATIETFRSAVHLRAKTRGLTVRTAIKDGTVIIQAINGKQ